MFIVLHCECCVPFQTCSIFGINTPVRSLQVRRFSGKGRGVVATRPFARGAFVLEYRGDVVPRAEAGRLSQRYEAAGQGSYLLEFRFRERWMW